MAKLQKSDQFVVKSNTLVEARYRLSLQESHVILWLLTQIRPDDEDFKLHSLKISDFANMVGVKVSGQYGELFKITEKLMRRILKIYEPETKEWLQVSWLSSARYKARQGVVLLEFSPQLKPYLLQLKSYFTKINISDTLKFRSIYAIMMYELLVQYAPIGKREITVDDLRSYCGIEEKEYALYADLKRKVINPAKTEINAKTEYAVDYKEVKESRKVAAINWTIKKKTQVLNTNREKPHNYVPINFEDCTVPEIVEFCKAHENILQRDTIDYLLNANALAKTAERLTITFPAVFYRDKCDTEEVKGYLCDFFEVASISLGDGR